MRWDNMFIAGVAVALGATRTAKAAIDAEEYDADEAARSGQVSVTIAPPGYPAPDFAAAAARQAIERAGFQPRHIGPLSHCWVFHPGVDAHNPASYVQRAAGIPGGHAPVTPTNAGCHGALDALDAICSYLTVHTEYTAGLVTAADVWPAPVFNRWQTGLDGAFGDGGSACVVSSDRGSWRLVSVVTTTDPDLEILYRGNAPFGPGHLDADHPMDLIVRTEHSLHALPDGEVHPRMRTAFRTSVDQATDEAGVALADVAHIVLPFAGGHVLTRRFIKWLGVDPAPTLASSAYGWRVGHLSASDPFAGFHHLAETKRLRPGDRVLLIADGGGYACTAAVIEVPK